MTVHCFLHAALGSTIVNRIYKYADVLHCEPIEKTANVYMRDYIRECYREGTVL